jgi:uncharacterized protein YuzE
MATSKKVSKQALSIDYDSTADILYISFGKPKAAICVEVNDGDLVRVDAYTDEVVGITIIDFKKRYIDTCSLSLTSIEESANAIVPKILEQFKH